MKVLICNDDGIHAPGIARLTAVAEKLFGAENIWVVAPASEQSAKSRALTLREPIYVNQLGPRRFSVEGTPVDCAVIAIDRIMRPEVGAPDLFLSGVNFGANLGEDIGYSGTVGCALEAVLEGVPAIGFSQAYPAEHRPELSWEVTDRYLELLLMELLKRRPFAFETMINVNFPNCKPDDVVGVSVVPSGRRRADINLVPVDAGPHHSAYTFGHLRSDREAAEESDVGQLIRNHITITPVQVNATNVSELARLNREVDIKLNVSN